MMVGSWPGNGKSHSIGQFSEPPEGKTQAFRDGRERSTGEYSSGGKLSVRHLAGIAAAGLDGHPDNGFRVRTGSFTAFGSSLNGRKERKGP